MPGSHRFDTDPAEASREVVEHELRKSGTAPSLETPAEQPEGGDVFAKAHNDIEGRRNEPSSLSEQAVQRPGSGPHARPELTNKEATPGAGTLPDPDKEEVEAISS